MGSGLGWTVKINLVVFLVIVGSAQKSCIEKSKKVWEVFFTGDKPGFFRAKNLSVSSKTL